MQINYRSDFDFILELRDGLGMPVGWPGFDWMLTLSTPTSRHPYVVFRQGKRLKGCFNDNGRIHVVCDNHGLGPGRVAVEFTANLPNGIYPDGVQRIVHPESLDIQLTTSGGFMPAVCVGDVTLCMPAYPAAPGEGAEAPGSARPHLTVDGSGNLVVHGCGELLDAGLTPVLFRRLRRNSRLTRDKDGKRGRRKERRWTRFSTYGDAVAVDRGTGVVSFRTDLLEPEGSGSYGRVTSADALVLRRSDWHIVYGCSRPFPCLCVSEGMRMLRFPFVLGFADLSDCSPARRLTLTDCAACVPFFVRYTPLHYYRGDEEVSAESLSDFSFNLA